MMQCLTDIIGVTMSDCQCIIAGLDTTQIAKLRKSNSGLYLDDLPGSVHLKAVNTVDACRKMYEMTQTAINNATKTVEDDLIIALNTRYKRDKVKFKGQIGRLSFAQSLGVSAPLQGLYMRPVEYGDGLITVSRIQIILNQAVNVTLKLYRVILDSTMGEEIGSWDVTTVANGYTTVTIADLPLKLPLVYNSEMVEYYFLYDISEPGVPVAPKDNGLVCSTCNKGVSPYAQYISVWGVQLTDASHLRNALSDNYSRGLVLDVEINCDNEKLFCREYQEDDAVAVTMANAVRFKAGELLIEDVLRQPDVNRYTTMDKERLWGKRNHFRAEYEARITYLSAVIDVTASNCYVCREIANQPFMAPIFI